MALGLSAALARSCNLGKDEAAKIPPETSSLKPGQTNPVRDQSWMHSLRTPDSATDSCAQRGFHPLKTHENQATVTRAQCQGLDSGPDAFDRVDGGRIVRTFRVYTNLTMSNSRMPGLVHVPCRHRRVREAFACRLPAQGH